MAIELFYSENEIENCIQNSQLTTVFLKDSNRFCHVNELANDHVCDLFYIENNKVGVFSLFFARFCA